MCHMSRVTCNVMCHISHVTFRLSLTPTATDPPLLTPPSFTLDCFWIQKALIYHDQKTLLKLL